ncbi:MAG: hypothetical protein DRN66_00530 [Candidatus Nanohalarchaeota archaeon]|nr:MAG: hypothetical protein DRN66_00530 [Candidatus Nanohaloarchaeota archaeon]
MPHKCVKCGKLHPDNADYLMNGCDECGAKFFFYVNEDGEEKAQRITANLTKKQVREMEKDVRSILGHKKNKILVLSIEAIRILSPGKYELDLVNLFNQTPLVIKIGEGKYEIDITELPKKKK